MGGIIGVSTATQVAGATGTPVQQHDHTAAGGCDMPGMKGGGGTDAAAGAGALGGGGSDLASALQGLSVAVKALADAVAKLTNKAPVAVAGVQGTAATANQYVTKAPNTVNTASGEDNDFEQRVLELINQERANAGLAPVAYNGTMDNAAEKHAQHMALVGQMAHDGIGDGDPGERIRAEGWSKGWGENVATGQTSPEQVVREWMNSPDHRRNILDPNFRSMGVSYTTSATGRSYWAQEFGA